MVAVVLSIPPFSEHQEQKQEGDQAYLSFILLSSIHYMTRSDSSDTLTAVTITLPYSVINSIIKLDRNTVPARGTPAYHTEVVIQEHFGEQVRKCYF